MLLGDCVDTEVIQNNQTHESQCYWRGQKKALKSGLCTNTNPILSAAQDTHSGWIHRMSSVTAVTTLSRVTFVTPSNVWKLFLEIRNITSIPLYLTFIVYSKAKMWFWQKLKFLLKKILKIYIIFGEFLLTILFHRAKSEGCFTQLYFCVFPSLLFFKYIKITSVRKSVILPFPKK